MRLIFASAVLALAVIPVSATAHHSHAMYESERRITLDGTVKEWQWANPHVFLYVIVNDRTGKPVEWVLEGGGTGGMTGRGWRADSFKPGDKIQVQFRPLKDGSSGGVLGTVFFPTGQSLNHPD